VFVASIDEWQMPRPCRALRNGAAERWRGHSFYRSFIGDEKRRSDGKRTRCQNGDTHNPSLLPEV
jgi:hypothetical protein